MSTILFEANGILFKFQDAATTNTPALLERHSIPHSLHFEWQNNVWNLKLHLRFNRSDVMLISEATFFKLFGSRRFKFRLCLSDLWYSFVEYLVLLKLHVLRDSLCSATFNGYSVRLCNCGIILWHSLRSKINAILNVIYCTFNVNIIVRIHV